MVARFIGVVSHPVLAWNTGDGVIVEFRSVVDAVRCAIEIQNAMVERNAGLPAERRIEFRIGIHLGDIVEESDGDLMGDGVNIAARLEGVAAAGAICLSEDAYRRFAELLRLETAQHFPGMRADSFRFWGDPSGDYRAQTDEDTPFKILRAAGINAYPAPTNDIDIRIEVVGNALSRLIDGQPGLIVDPRCVTIHKGLRVGLPLSAKHRD